MTEPDALFDDLIERQISLLRYDASLRKTVVKSLNELSTKVRTRINKSDPASATTFQTQRVARLLQALNKSIKATFREVDDKLRLELVEMAKVEATKTESTFASVVGVPVVAIPNAQLKALYNGSLIEGALSSDWWSRQAAASAASFADAVREGVELGESNASIIRRIVGTRAARYMDGVMQISRRRAEALVRTSVQTVANDARMLVFEANNHLIERYRFVATLDGRTSVICIPRDGLMWQGVNKKPIGHNVPFSVPPLHFNCRSVLIPMTAGTKVLEVAKRASMDGEVSAKITFNDFLKTKSVAFQDRLLGKGKATLWRSGKISLLKLLDQSGRPLTLSELKVKYGLK